MLCEIVFQVAAGLRPKARCGHAHVLGEQSINMSIIGQNSLSHEIKDHLFNLWPELPVPWSVNCLHTRLKQKRKEPTGLSKNLASISVNNLSSTSYSKCFNLGGSGLFGTISHGKQCKYIQSRMFAQSHGLTF